MTTVERFYFKIDYTSISVSGNSLDYIITFVPTDDDPVELKIRVRGAAEFKKLLDSLTLMGNAILGVTSRTFDIRADRDPDGGHGG